MTTWTIKPAPIPVQFLGNSHPPPCNHDGIHRKFHNLPIKSQNSESESIGVLGQKILLRSNESNQNKPVPKEKEISGSDVLWAIQRAAAQKKKKSNSDKKKKMMTKTKMRGVEESSSTDESTGDNGVDFSNVTPLNIKSDWGQRLEELEKVLKEIQDSEI